MHKNKMDDLSLTADRIARTIELAVDRIENLTNDGGFAFTEPLGALYLAAESSRSLSASLERPET